MTYHGTLDEERVNDLILAFGELIEQSGDLGFILTYHASEDGGAVMDLAGRGVDQQTLGVLLAAALERNETHGCTL